MSKAYEEESSYGCGSAGRMLSKYLGGCEFNPQYCISQDTGTQAFNLCTPEAAEGDEKSCLASASFWPTKLSYLKMSTTTTKRILKQKKTNT